GAAPPVPDSLPLVQDGLDHAWQAHPGWYGAALGLGGALRPPARRPGRQLAVWQPWALRPPGAMPAAQGKGPARDAPPGEVPQRPAALEPHRLSTGCPDSEDPQGPAPCRHARCRERVRQPLAPQQCNGAREPAPP